MIDIRNKSVNFALGKKWSDARVAEEARLESVYTPKAYPEFESRSLRQKEGELPALVGVPNRIFRPLKPIIINIKV